MLTRSRKLALVILPLTLFLVTAGMVALISVSYHDSVHRWTADAAILTGAALMAALVGVPIALYQLFTVERDLARLVLVPPMHFEQLRGALEASRLTLDRQTKLSFGEPHGGRQLYREAFFAHFPELSHEFTEWDSAVERVRATHASFADELERLADRVGIDPAIYHRDAILQALKEVTRPSLHLKLEEWPPGTVPVAGSVDGSVEIAGIRTAIPRPAADSLSENELQSMLQPLRNLCEAARDLPEVRRIARAQDSLKTMIQPLADKLSLYLATETIPVSKSCPICQRNLGA